MYKPLKGRILNPLSVAVFSGLMIPSSFALGAITTDFSVTADDGSFHTIDINQDREGWENASSASDSTSYTYTYIAINFTTDADGSYTFGQNPYVVDTTMAVYYNGSFDLDNLVDADAYNDDGTDGSKQCGGHACPTVTANLTADQVNTLVISTYNPTTGGNLTLPISAFAIGPGNVLFALYTPSSTSVASSTASLRNLPAYGAAVVIDATPELLALFEGLSGDDQISDAASQTLPLFTGGGGIAARTALYGINSAVKARQNVTLGRASGTGLNSGDALLQDKYFWIKPFGTRTEQDDRNGVSGYDADTGGLVLGLDGTFGQQTRVGVAFAYANTRVDGKSSVAPHDLDVDSYQLIGYGSRDLGNDTDLTLQFDVGQNRNEGKRTIQFNNSKAEADYDSYTAHLGVGLARSYDLNSANRATAGIKTDYTWIRDESYRETGAGLLNLDVDSNTTEALVAGLEGQLSHSVNQAVELNANLGLGYDVLNEQTSITSAYAAAPGAQFTTEGIDPNPWIATGGVGLLHIANNGAELSANYDVEYRSDYLSQSVSLKLRWAF